LVSSKGNLNSQNLKIKWLHLPNKARLNLTTKCIDKSNTLPIPVAKYICFSRELRKGYLQDKGIGKEEMRTENGH